MFLIIRILFILIFSFSLSHAADIWVNPAGSETSPYETKEKGLTTIVTGVAAMSGGDTLYIADGTYTGDGNMMEQIIPAGTAPSYTKVYAETDFSVIIDGESTGGRVPIDINNNYIEVQGLIFKNADGSGSNQDGPAVFVRSSYVKFKNCGAVDGSLEIVGNEDSSTWSITGASYILLEDCFGYGNGHYTFAAYGSDHVVMRRCVGRKDMWTRGVGSIFTAYNSTYISYQNCIALDFDNPRNWHPYSNDGTWGGFDQHGTSTNIEYLGCIAMNMQGANGTVTKNIDGTTTTQDYNPGFFINTGGAGTTDITNCSVIGSICAVMPYGPITIENLTVTNMNTDATATFGGTGIYRVANDDAIVTDSIFHECATTGTRGIDQISSDYNAYYGNGTDYGDGDSARTNDVSYDPETNGLLYPVRIETGSTLKTDGSSGGQIGAEILKKYGTDDTIWGDSGYNTLSANNLWPYPNEDTIKTNMAAYARQDPYDSISQNTEINGDRGFAADTVNPRTPTGKITLTSYIWEYLGNEIPKDIYGLTNIEVGTGTSATIGAGTSSVFN